MENLILHKVRLSVLWLFYEVAFLVDMMLGSAESGAIEKIGPEILLLFAIILLVPLMMAFLSLTLKDSINRWANIILGIVFTGLMLIALTESAAAYLILLTLSKVVAGALIAWYAWKWPKKKD